MNRPPDRSPEGRIREWLAAAPERAPERAVDDTIDKLRETRQPRMFVVRLSMPIAAALAAVALVVGGAGLWVGLRPGSDAASPLTTGADCSLEMIVGGRSPILLGRGFAPDTDVVLEVDLANGSHGTITVKERAELHTDSTGRFGLPLLAHPDNLGSNQMTASAAGCTATVEMIVTADQLPAPCPDQVATDIALRDGTAYRAAVAAHRPAHLWHLDEAAGTTADDAAGGADGRWVGQPTPIGSAGTRALFLDGAASNVEIPQLTFDEFTVEALVYLCDVVDNADAIVGNGLDAPSINFFDMRLRLFTGAEDVVIAESPATLGEWQHWAITRDATGTRIYLDGVLDASGPAWIGEMVIAQIGRGDAGSLRGILDEVAIYDRALTGDELRSHAEARSGP